MRLGSLKEPVPSADAMLGSERKSSSQGQECSQHEGAESLVLTWPHVLGFVHEELSCKITAICNCGRGGGRVSEGAGGGLGDAA